jgi:YfiH family protein
VLSLGSLGGDVRFAFTTRAGGVSAAPFDALNQSVDVGDDPAAVATNRARVLARLGVRHAVWLKARHGADVVEVTDADAVAAAPAVDAMVTTQPGLALAALSADCMLVVLADHDNGVVGVAHCGRPGLTAGVIARVAARMREIGAASMRAALGPSICAACYEVPQPMADDVWSAVPSSEARSRDGAPAIDIAAGVTAQLAAEGVDVVRRVGGCTREDPSLFSYRRDGVTGRLGALVWRAP